MSALALFVSTYLLVLCLGAQSLLVNNGKYTAAFCNSFAIGVSNLILFKLAPNASGLEVFAYLAGGPLGITSAMYLLRSYHQKRAP